MEKILEHEASNVRDFYSTLSRPVRVGIEATGSMPWFLNLMEELGIECQSPLSDESLREAYFLGQRPL